MPERCQHCQAPIPDSSHGGLCPACLISLAGFSTADQPRDEHAPRSLQELEGRIPGIQLTSLLGHGGMGAVYRGHQTDLDREVAVKILPHSLSNDPIFAQRFRREARALAKLDHPNIVTVFGSGVADGLCYIVMEYVEGTTLREAMAAQAIDPAAALRIVPQICEALAYAHDHGVVHRDIKPENILLGVGGKVKVVDFGLAKLSDDDRALTMLTATGARMGTLRYMAPEQLDGMSVDHRADVYSLGVVFYEMLTGQVPMGRFAMPSEKSGVDPRIDAVVMRTLCREPSERYQHVSDLEDELKSIADTPLDSSWPKQTGQFAGQEWKSRMTFFGWPLVHIAFGKHPRTGKKLVAKGVIAVGDLAVGGLAVGGVSFGLISLGGVAAGVNAFGGVAAGVQLAMGGLAIGGAVFGGAAAGLIACGGAAVGGIAFGGAATGYVAGGGVSHGTYQLTGIGQWNPPEFADSLFALGLADPRFPVIVGILAALMMLGPILLVASMALVGFVRSSERGIKEQPVPAEVRRHLYGVLIGLLLSMMAFELVCYIQAEMLSRIARAPQVASAEQLALPEPANAPQPQRSP